MRALLGMDGTVAACTVHGSWQSAGSGVWFGFSLLEGKFIKNRLHFAGFVDHTFQNIYGYLSHSVWHMERRPVYAFW